MFKLTLANAVSPILIFGRLTVVATYGPAGGVDVAVGAIVGVEFGAVEVGTIVGVGVGTESNTFNNGLNKPTVSPFFLNVVLFQNQL